VREVRFGRRLYCQSVIALLALREGGNFVVKMFDSITPFTVGLLFLLHRCFSSISIHRPQISSASLGCSERFLICRGFKRSAEETEELTQFLLQIHGMVTVPENVRRFTRTKLRKRLNIDKMEVMELVPLREITSHSEFFEFIRATNLKLVGEFVASIRERWIDTMNRYDEDKVMIAINEGLWMGKDEEDKEGIIELNSKSFGGPEELIKYLAAVIVGCDRWKSGDNYGEQLNCDESSSSSVFFPIQSLPNGILGSAIRGRGIFVGN
jgi:hypothetical protein